MITRIITGKGIGWGGIMLWRKTYSLGIDVLWKITKSPLNNPYILTQEEELKEYSSEDKEDRNIVIKELIPKNRR